LGYVSEARGALVAFTFEVLVMNPVGTEVFLENVTSLGVMAKNGFSAGALYFRWRSNLGVTVLMREMWLSRVDWERRADD